LGRGTTRRHCFFGNASGAHLAGLGAAIAAIKTPLVVEVLMTSTVFDPQLLKQFNDMRLRIGERLLTDAGKLCATIVTRQPTINLSTSSLPASGVTLGGARLLQTRARRL